MKGIACQQMHKLITKTIIKLLNNQCFLLNDQRQGIISVFMCIYFQFLNCENGFPLGF